MKQKNVNNERLRHYIIWSLRHLGGLSQRETQDVVTSKCDSKQPIDRNYVVKKIQVAMKMVTVERYEVMERYSSKFKIQNGGQHSKLIEIKQPERTLYRDERPEKLTLKRDEKSRKTLHKAGFCQFLQISLLRSSLRITTSLISQHGCQII